MIDRQAPEPPYIQLAAILRDAIKKGDYKPRQPIPSIQEMVREYGLAMGTIRKAIKVLIEQKYVYTVPGHGTFVADRLP